MVKTLEAELPEGDQKYCAGGVVGKDGCIYFAPFAAGKVLRVTTEGGDVFTEELKPDGTYIQTDADGTVVETGRWVQKSPQDYCWTVDEQYREEGDTGAEKCNTEAVGADGVWTSTNADGETATVERM